MVGEHEAGDTMWARHVGGPPAERHLDRGGAPGNEGAELALADSLERLVHLRRVHLALDDVEDRNVAAAILAGRA